MENNKRKNGTFIHGIAASEHLDSSGERIMIEGVDISSLTRDGVLNMEHQSKEASSIIGKIWEAKKILKAVDCDNEHHRYFWNKVKMPYIYIAGELFDGVGHKEASEIAAMLRFDNQESLNKDAKKLINFSIEGSRVEKSGQIITKCIARKVSVTLTPCNKVCEAEELHMDDGAEKESDSGSFKFIQDIMDKSDSSSCELIKGEVPFLYKNDINASEKTPVTMTARTAVDEHTHLIGVLQSPSHKDDVKEAKKQGKELKEYKEKLNKNKDSRIPAHPKDPVLNYDKIAPKAQSEEKQKQYAARVKSKLSKYDSNVRKTLTASCGVGSSPSAKVGGAVLGKEEFVYKNESMPNPQPNVAPNQGTKIGRTDSGKDIFSHGRVGEYKGFSPQDHAQAADFHRQMVNKMPSFKDKDFHMQKMKLHNAAFSNAREKQIGMENKKANPSAMQRPAAPAPMPMKVSSNNGVATGTRSSPQGTMGYSATATNYGKPAAPATAAIPSAMPNPNMKMAKSEAFLIRKLGVSDIEKGSKNVREQRKKVFGTNAQPGSKTPMREKHIAHIKQFIDKHLGLDLQPSGGKVNDKTGERRKVDNEEGVDKPDWRSGKFEAQWNPEAIVHEIAHLMLLPKGVGLEEGQRLMDKQYSDVQKEHGYMQQKRSKYEVQPMAAEQLIRRAMGLPASKVSIPVKSPNDPQRMSLEDPKQSIATRIQSGKSKDGSPKFVDLIRQSRNLHPEHKQRLEDIFSGKIKFDPDNGWSEGAKTLDGAISNRQPGAVVARQNKNQMAAPQTSELPPNVVRMKQPAPAAPVAPVAPTIDAPTVNPEVSQPPMKIAKSEQRQVMKVLGDQAFESFEKKEELLEFLAERLPNLSERERLALAKAVAYTSEKKKEEALKALLEE